MKRVLLLALMVICFWEKGRSQYVLDDKRYIDSLKNTLTQPVSDSIKAYACFELSNYYCVVSDTALSTQYLERIKAYNKNNSRFFQAVYEYQLASNGSERDGAGSQSLCIKADSLLMPSHDKNALFFRARIWSLYGRIEELKDHQSSTLSQTMDKCIPLATAAGRMGYVGLLYAYIGLDFTNQLEWTKADTYYERAIRMCSSEPNRSYILYVYLKAAENDFYRDSLNSAKQFLDSSEQILRPYPQSHFYIEYYYDKAMYCITKKQFAESISCVKKGAEVAGRFGQDYQVQRLLFLEQQAYSGEGNYAAASDVLLYLINHEAFPQAQNNLYYYSFLSEAYVNLKDYKQAYIWQKKYAMLLDSTDKSSVKSNMNSLEVKFRTAEKEKQIVQLAAEKKQAELTAQSDRLYNWLLGVVCLLLLLAVIFALLFYRNGRKITAQEIRELEQRQQLDVAQAMLDGEERERIRVAQDLHDGLGGMLAGVKLNLSGWMEGSAHDKVLSKVIDQLDGSVTELRKIARNMMPETLLKYGLENALRELCDFYVSTKCRIHLQTLGLKSDVPVSVQIHIYRIIQELLANAVKHANATKIIVQCSQHESLFLITVEDDGEGFDLSSMDASKGLGLRNLTNRAAFLKAKIDFHSSKEEGTTVNIELNAYEA